MAIRDGNYAGRSLFQQDQKARYILIHILIQRMSIL